MPTVDDNRLKGNFGAAYVSALLSSECLVRPVATDTDVGVDLYCETVEETTPHLHFWIQVKSGTQCRYSADRRSASCSFTSEHLQYWYRQPVPVFAALVPVDWPVTVDPVVYIVDVSKQLLDGVSGGCKSVTLASDYVWEPRNRADVRHFLDRVVPVATARLLCRAGAVSRIPTVDPIYEFTTPEIPVAKFSDKILHQLRTTAAFSILFLYRRGEFEPKTAHSRRILASIVAQFGDDQHWENFMARALSHHEDRTFDQAAEFYDKAISCIQNDPNLASIESWKKQVNEIEQLKNAAKKKGLLNESSDASPTPRSS